MALPQPPQRSGLATALFSIGDDMESAERQRQREAALESQLSERLAMQQALGQMRADVSLEAAQMRYEAKIAEIAAKYQRQLPDEFSASLAGLTQPEFNEARDFQQRGPQYETKMTADADEAAFLDGFDREALRASGGMRGETEASMRGRANVEKFRNASIAASIPPNELDDFTLGFEMINAQRDPSLSNEERAKRIAALKGMEMRKVRGDTLYDPYTGDSEMTDRGEAKSENEKLRANRPTGSKTQPTGLREANTAVETARRALKDARQAAMDSLLRSNPRSLSLSADQREQWINARPAVQEAARAFSNAQENMNRLLQGGQGALPSGVTRNEVVRQAKEAIARGASRALVLERLRKMGITDFNF